MRGWHVPSGRARSLPLTRLPSSPVPTSRHLLCRDGSVVPARFFEVRHGLCDCHRVAFGKELPSNIVLLVLRAVVGANLAWLHGWDKLSHFSAKAGSFPDPLGMGAKYALILAIAGEFFGAICMATGLAGRVGAFLVSFTTGLTLFAVLHGTAWKEREVWELYFAASVTILLLGCGRFSLDSVVWKKLGKGGKSGGKPAASPAKR
jgi:putative oxidoreductase